jgi:DME family drug/metabolite transporter
MAILLSIVAALCFASVNIFASLGLRHMKNSIGTIISLVSSAAVILTLAAIFKFEEILSLPLIAFGWFCLLGIISHGMGRLFQFAGIGRIGAAKSATLLATTPLFATVLAITFLKERPTPLVILGSLAIVVGVILIVNEGRRRVV